jgi:hypothetical protein
MANSEQIESELVSLNNKTVIVVRPNFGAQSDSWGGQLTMLNTNYPPKFHFSATGMAIFFTVDDVVKLDPPVDNRTEKIIRLKGPHDYSEAYKVTA